MADGTHRPLPKPLPDRARIGESAIIQRRWRYGLQSLFGVHDHVYADQNRILPVLRYCLVA